MTYRQPLRAYIVTIVIVFLGTAGIAHEAHAEAGEGLKMGPLIFSPRLDLSASYRSNLYREAGSIPTSASEPVRKTKPTPVPTLNITPGFKLNLTEGGLFDFGLDAHVAWNQVFGDRIVREQSGVTAGVDLSASVNKNGAVSFGIRDLFLRELFPPSSKSEVVFSRIDNTAGVVLGVHPGGRALQGYLSYDFVRAWYSPADELQRMEHRLAFNGEWYFLPKTSAFIEAKFDLIQYDRESSYKEGDIRKQGDLYLHSNSHPLRVSTGVQGLITPRLSTRLMVGYGNSFHKANSFNNVIAAAQVRWRLGQPQDNNGLQLGYEYNFAEATVGQMYSYHRPYFGYTQGALENRLRWAASIGVNFRSFVDVPASSVVQFPKQLQDVFVEGSAHISYDIFRWWSLKAAYSFVGNFTGDKYRVVPQGGLPSYLELRTYTEHVATLSTTFRY